MTVDPDEYKSQTISAYDKLAGHLAQGYDAYFETVVRSEADHFLAGLAQGDAILDLGCGAGAASCYFAERGYIPLSADLSAEMLRECRRRGLCDVVRLDLEHLPFRQRSFRGVWAHTSMIHIPKSILRYALQGVRETLYPGGTLFVALREGQGQGYEGEWDAERWFSNFQEGEFETYVPEGLDIVRSNATEFRGRVFLNYHLTRTPDC